MQEPLDTKMYFYFDESGSPAILGHHGKNLLKENETSKTFMVGYLQTDNPHQLTVDLEKLRQELMQDKTLMAVPSIKNLKYGFHANKDCQEVRREVFKLLMNADFEAYIIVARKDEANFRRRFNMNEKRIYKFLVGELLKNRVHLYKNIDIYFSEMKNVTTLQNMTDAVKDATEKFQYKWGKENHNNIRIFVQQSTQIPLLQVIDYVLWTVFRAYERGEFRYFDVLRDKIKLVHDIFDTETNRYYGAFYTDKNPLEAKKISPISS